ncbi:hypothetical protein CYMTET_51438 [Cymbomonas tetramitiformis]|uniref:Uncharacterized protein n=1 Tax=Cymbomonas tetramitiformis TaxID=36881 RepID=A0AAE0ETP6_9CHLO|nr:hypothetical protein CYMTET_51438 [Cymbomonas tetramitiformis]
MEGGFRLKPFASVISLCLQLGITLPLVREVSAVGTVRCACGGEVDEFCKFSDHYLICNRRGMITHRHDAVQDVLVEMLRKAKKFLEECARGRQDRLGPELVSATWSTPKFMSYWGQKIMVALQGAQAFGLHIRALKDYPQ